VPFGWKLCVSVVPWTICLTANVVLEALELALAELLLLLVLVFELELELELELEHPAIATRPAATTVTLSQVALRVLKMFTNDLYAIRVTHGTAELNAQVNGSWREDGQTLQICSALRSAYGRGSVLRAWVHARPGYLAGSACQCEMSSARSELMVRSV
jgi:hypothetical protein